MIIVYGDFDGLRQRKNKANLMVNSSLFVVQFHGFVIPVKLVLAKAGNRNPGLFAVLDSASRAE
jgi:hypothetical protein